MTGPAPCRTGAAPARARYPSPEDVARLADVLAGARRPVFIAGRGARRRARASAWRWPSAPGALLATSAVARGPVPR